MIIQLPGGNCLKISEEISMKACKNCRLIVMEGSTCPSCQGTELTEKFSGQLIVLDPAKSQIGQKLGVGAPGRYAIKIRER